MQNKIFMVSKCLDQRRLSASLPTVSQKISHLTYVANTDNHKRAIIIDTRIKDSMTSRTDRNIFLPVAKILLNNINLWPGTKHILSVIGS